MLCLMGGIYMGDATTPTLGYYAPWLPCACFQACVLFLMGGIYMDDDLTLTDTLDNVIGQSFTHYYIIYDNAIGQPFTYYIVYMTTPLASHPHFIILDLLLAPYVTYGAPL